MKAILEFSLPEESEEHRIALEGGKLLHVITELDNWLRSIAKHGSDNIEASKVRKELYDLADSVGVKIC